MLSLFITNYLKFKIAIKILMIKTSLYCFNKLGNFRISIDYN